MICLVLRFTAHQHNLGQRKDEFGKHQESKSPQLLELGDA
jgi:hypothetical protein